MNERIRQLAEQAGQVRLATTDNPSADEIMVLIGPNIEKFAELIVRECVDICNNTNGASYLNGVYAGRQIKQHFGVEE